jgi:hypothetical protein
MFFSLASDTAAGQYIQWGRCCFGGAWPLPYQGDCFSPIYIDGIYFLVAHFVDRVCRAFLLGIAWNLLWRAGLLLSLHI